VCITEYGYEALPIKMLETFKVKTMDNKCTDTTGKSEIGNDFIADVRLSLPSQKEIDEQIDGYAFRVPYDGSNNFYDEVALKHYKAGIEWLLKRIKGN
jgi:hypothetical protein